MARPQKNSKRATALIITGLLVLIIFLPSSISRSVRGGFGRVLSPVLSFGSSIGLSVHEYVSNIRSLPTLVKDRSTLQQQVLDLQQQVVGLANATRENEALRKELGITNRPHTDETVAATIISRSTNNVLGEALIDQGKNARITVGQAVIAQGALVGQVKTVYDTTAIISLMNSRDSIVQAMLTDSEALGLVTGGPTGLRLGEIDQNITIKEGEIVQTSGLGGAVPRGLIIGSIDRVTSESGSAKQTAIVHSPIIFDQLRLVFVVLRNINPQ